MSTDPNDTDDAEIQGIPVSLARQAFKQTFPGADIKTGSRIGGKVMTAQIWQFQVELSVTEHAISFADTEGEATITVTFWPAKKRPSMVIHQESTTSPTRVVTLVKDTRKFLEGIAAAITIACEERYDREVDSIRELFE